MSLDNRFIPLQKYDIFFNISSGNGWGFVSYSLYNK